MTASLRLYWCTATALARSTKSALTVPVAPGAGGKHANLRAFAPSSPDSESTGSGRRSWSRRETRQVGLHRASSLPNVPSSRPRQQSRECLLALSLQRLVKERRALRLVDETIPKTEKGEAGGEAGETRGFFEKALEQEEKRRHIDRMIIKHLVELSTLYHAAFFSSRSLGSASRDLGHGSSPVPSVPPRSQPTASGCPPPQLQTPQPGEAKMLCRGVEKKTDTGNPGHLVRQNLPSPLQCCVVLHACAELLHQPPLATGRYRRGKWPSANNLLNYLSERNGNAGLYGRVYPAHREESEETYEGRETTEDENPDWSAWGSLPLLPELPPKRDHLTCSPFSRKRDHSFSTSPLCSPFLAPYPSVAGPVVHPLPATFFASCSPSVLLQHVLALYTQRSFAVLHLCSAKQLAMLSTELNKLLLLLPLPPTVHDAEVYVRLAERRALQWLAHRQQRRTKRLVKHRRSPASPGAAESASRSSFDPSPTGTERVKNQLSSGVSCSVPCPKVAPASSSSSSSWGDVARQTFTVLGTHTQASQDPLIQRSPDKKERSPRESTEDDRPGGSQAVENTQLFPSRPLRRKQIQPQGGLSRGVDHATAWLGDLDHQARFLPHVCVVATLLGVIFQTLSVRLSSDRASRGLRLSTHPRTLSVIALNVSVANGHVTRLINHGSVSQSVVSDCQRNSDRRLLSSGKKDEDHQVTTKEARELTIRVLASALATGRSLVLGGVVQAAGASGSAPGDSQFLRICVRGIGGFKAKDLCMLLTGLIRLGLPSVFHHDMPPEVSSR